LKDQRYFRQQIYEQLELRRHRHLKLEQQLEQQLEQLEQLVQQELEEV
jgi:hypothetical protein